MLLNKNISHAPEEMNGYDKNNQNEESNNKEKEDLKNVKR